LSEITLASSAAQISIQTSIQAGASVHAPHGKAHNKTPPSGDSFADMLAGAREDNASAPAPAAKTAGSEKPEPKERAQEDVGTEQKQTGKIPAESQTETAQTAEEAQPLSDGQAQPDAANDNAQANDNAEDGALVDVAAALPQTTEPAPAPQQPAPVLTLAAQPAMQGETQPAAEGQTDSAEADIAPVTGNAPAKPAPQLPGTQNTQDAQAPNADKPAAPDTALTAAKDAATDTKTTTGVSDFSKALQETQTGPQDAQPASSAGETAKPAETAAAPTAPRPSPETNTIALATPAAPAHQPAAPQGAEKLAVTAQTASQDAPQAAPNVNQMAVEVAARSQSGAKQFEIRLDPPELGRVEVRLSIDAHGKAEAHLTADQPQTLELLQKDAPTLARALRDAGLNVAQDALNFSLKNQQQQQAGGDDASRHGARGNFHNNPPPAAEQPESGAYVRRGLGLLDIKV
jgi:flagellar hook-length control protein FliK